VVLDGFGFALPVQQVIEQAFKINSLFTYQGDHLAQAVWQLIFVGVEQRYEAAFGAGQFASLGSI